MNVTFKLSDGALGGSVGTQTNDYLNASVCLCSTLPVSLSLFVPLVPQKPHCQNSLFSFYTLHYVRNQ